MKLFILFLLAGLVSGAGFTIAGEPSIGHKKAENHRNHQHKKNCGHPSTKHGDHEDYEHDGHQHRKHGNHYDECSTGAESPEKK